jgi:hypothetical protein
MVIESITSSAPMGAICTLFASAATLLQLANTAFAQSPPHLVSKVELKDTEVMASASTGLTMGDVHIAFAQSTLQEIGARLNYVLIRHQTSADGTFGWLCFTILGEDAYRVWITSDDEFGGSDRLVTSIFAARIEADAKATDSCPEPPVKYRTVKLDNGIWLGSSNEQIGLILGLVPPNSDGWSRYTYSGEQNVVSRGKSANFDVSSSLDLRLQNGRVIALRAAKFLSD